MYEFRIQIVDLIILRYSPVAVYGFISSAKKIDGNDVVPWEILR